MAHTMIFRTALYCLSFVFLILGQASANLVSGEEFRVDNVGQSGPAPGQTFTFEVNSAPGFVEVPLWGNTEISIDFFNAGVNTASVLITEESDPGGTYAPSPNLVFFTALDSGFPQLLNVSIGAASGVFNDPSRVAFSGNTFSFDLGGLPNGTNFVQLDLVAVPEPSTALMALCTASGILVLRRQLSHL